MTRLIAIGDIHGEYYLFKDLLEKLNITKDDTLIFLGDYIDRGLYSKQVIDKLIELSNFCHCEFLMGNHEYFLLKTIDGDEDAKYFFMNYGGEETIESYGGEFKNIYKIHGDFYKNLKPYYITDNYIFVHGGIKPNWQLSQLDLYDILMIRNEFIDNPTNLKQKVVFGHTPFDKPLIKSDKIGIDTGSGKFDNGYITAFICNTETFVFSKKKNELSANI